MSFKKHAIGPLLDDVGVDAHAQTVSNVECVTSPHSCIFESTHWVHDCTVT